MTERIPRLLDLQAGIAQHAHEQALLRWARESKANQDALVAAMPEVLTQLNIRGKSDLYDALVQAYERVRAVSAKTESAEWRPWVVYTLAEGARDHTVGDEVPDAVLALVNEWWAAWDDLADTLAEATAALEAA